MAQINVVVHGVLGNMGQETLRMAMAADDMNPVGAADAAAAPGTLALPDGSGQIPLSNDLAAVLSGADPTPDVVVDFSRADGAVAALRTATAAGVNVVVGTTGLGESDYAEADALANEHGVGVMIAPNFAMGAVLMIHLAKRAARFFEYADLTETHHEAKIDAPSGTALAIAQAVVDGKGGGFASVPAEKELIAGPRGGVYEGVSVHSARMPGRVAHHELTFGGLGQTLTIRHDSISRESFMPGVAMAVRDAVNRKGLIVGLENIMGLG